ncbi:MAG TPA: peptidoglycan editing factor PgeF [Luteimonas sp.]|nr:peptidoglycan editing factor PgeF [Luteimonas sp.]
MSAVHARWPLPAGVHALTTLRSAPGVSKPPFDRCNLGNVHAADGDAAADVQANRGGLVAAFGLPSAPRWLRQVHGTAVIRFDTAGPADAGEPEADAAVTSSAGTVLAVLSADCMPVVFAARAGDEIAVAHAGWRGLAAGVLERTLAAMRTPAAAVHAWLGPAAGPRFYEVGGDVHDAFVLADPRAGACFSPTRAGHWHVDLPALARLRLADAGIAGIAGVHGGDLCTIAEPLRFFSHRRDRRTGRMATLAWFDAPHRAP